MTDPCEWPEPLNREQREILRQREKAFFSGIKAQTKAHGWRFAGGEIFRQDGDWFASVRLGIRRDRGIGVAMTLKPMALDTLFWDIVELPENASLPLSFRANGAWVLRPPPIEDRLGADVSDLDELARVAIQWSDAMLSGSRRSRSIGQALAAFPDDPHPNSHFRATAICLHILADDLKGALALCQPERSGEGLLGPTAGFSLGNRDGTMRTFTDLARAWIAARRREALELV
jgi:hypothetical protein